MWGIDVSHHQGVIDWSAVKRYGIQFAIMKVMYETSHRTDEIFNYNYYQCGEQQLQRGAYIYVIATTPGDATKEAVDFITALEGKQLELGIWLDLEDKRIRNLGKEALNSIISIEAEIFRLAGYKVGIYSNLDWYKNVLDGIHLIQNYQWWMARYPKNDNGTIKPVLKPDNNILIWQYSSKGKVDGINGNVDMNYYVSDLIKTSTQIAQEVVEGEWGNGQIRINRLEAAGYDVTHIQQLVSALLHDKKYYRKYDGLSFRIDEVFRAIGVESKYIGNKYKREPIAQANEIVNYSGTLIQNLRLVALAKQGQLRRP